MPLLINYVCINHNTCGQNANKNKGDRYYPGVAASLQRSERLDQGRLELTVAAPRWAQRARGSINSGGGAAYHPRARGKRHGEALSEVRGLGAKRGFARGLGQASLSQEGATMSLYDDLRVERSDSKTEGWSKNFKLLQSQLQVKKAALTQAKNQRGKQSTVLAPVVDLKRNSGPEERTSFPEPPPPPPVATTPKESGAAQMAFMGEMLIPVADEYDPMYPNDYDKVVKRQREDRQRQREHERQKEIDDREKRRKERHEASGMSRRPESDDEEEYEAEKRKRGTMGAAIAPPSSLMERDKDLAPDDEIKRGRMSGKAAIPPPNYEDSGERPRSPPGGSSSFISNMGGTVAHKIMQKYGFREGQGLGKHEQGLSTALSVEKTSKRGGKIVIGDNVPKEAEAATVVAAAAAAAAASPSPASAKKQEPNPLTEILKNPTKVVLLRNMVGPGEVDEDLESETKEECEKYGKVIKCVIFEMPGAPEDDAVRIFLEFERMESAIKAVVDLNGRYFGGRIVKAGFYNLDKFRRLDLATSV